MTYTTYIRLLRPTHWLKNLMLFFPPFLGGMLADVQNLTAGFVPFIAFSLCSSATYIVNDLLDQRQDAAHPDKKQRPIASGLISMPAAAGLSVLLLVIAVVCGTFFSQHSILVYLLTYTFISIAYSCCLKNYPVIDLFCISTGFLLRLLAGGTVYAVPVSTWLFISVLLLSLFLSAGKRLNEQIVLGDGAEAHRPTLGQYPAGYLDGILFMTGGAVLVTYSMYTLSHPFLIYSVPLCCFGLMRYILLAKGGKGGDPTKMLIRDPVLFITSSIWVFMVGWGVYAG